MKKTITSRQKNTKPKMSAGYDFEWAIRFGVLYEPRYKELSIYFGPLKFWMAK